MRATGSTPRGTTGCGALARARPSGYGAGRGRRGARPRSRPRARRRPLAGSPGGARPGASRAPYRYPDRPRGARARLPPGARTRRPRPPPTSTSSSASPTASRPSPRWSGRDGHASSEATARRPWRSPTGSARGPAARRRGRPSPRSPSAAPCSRPGGARRTSPRPVSARWRAAPAPLSSAGVAGGGSAVAPCSRPPDLRAPYPSGAATILPTGGRSGRCDPASTAARTGAGHEPGGVDRDVRRAPGSAPPPARPREGAVAARAAGEEPGRIHVQRQAVAQLAHLLGHPVAAGAHAGPGSAASRRSQVAASAPRPGPGPPAAARAWRRTTRRIRRTAPAGEAPEHGVAGEAQLSPRTDSSVLACPGMRPVTPDNLGGVHDSVAGAARADGGAGPGVPSAPRGAPQARATAGGAGPQGLAHHRGGAGGEAAEEGEAAAQGPDGSPRSAAAA